MNEPISEHTRNWLEEKGFDDKALQRYVRRRIVMPRYTRIRAGKSWTPSPGTRFATGDDIERILHAVRTAYSGLGDDYAALDRLADAIRCNEIARSKGHEAAFCCLRETSENQLVFMIATLRKYKKSPKGYFDIEYFWIYEWISTIPNDAVENIALMKDLRRFYGHLSSRAKRPLNVRARTHRKTSARVSERIKTIFERELANRGMASSFKFVTRKRSGENMFLAMNNSLNSEIDAARRKANAADQE